MQKAKSESKKKEISFSTSIIPIVFLVFVLFFSIAVFDKTAHIPLILATAMAGLIAGIKGYSFKEIQKSMLKGINLAMGAVLILIIIGTMIGTWILAGIVPTMIYYGLQLLSPGIFLVATLLICAIISLGTGSSWSTAGTVGVALIIIGKGLGVPVPMVAGAIISGAYFGDKMSPLSDTTNLAPAISGTDVFTHIWHMIYTTGPSFIISIILYSILGLKYSGKAINPERINLIVETLEKTFFIHPVLLLAPVIIIILVIKKVPPLPALLIGSIIGAICAAVFQGSNISAIMDAAQVGFVSTTKVPMVDNLLSRGGLMSMMETVGIIICALSFGGIMEGTGMLNAISKKMMKRVKTTGSLVTSTILSCIAMNILAAEQYMSIVIPGRMFKDTYKKHGLHPKNLSRCLEDSATLTSPLIPWNSCGAFMGATLGISPFLYLPFAFLNLLNPIISIIYGYTGFSMEKLKDKEEKIDTNLNSKEE